MYLLISDESQNQQTDHTKFFIYGSIIVESEKVPGITDGMEAIREKYGFLPTDSFKFSPNDKPGQVSKPNFINAKKEALVLAKACSVRFMGYAMLHAIGKNKKPEELITWGADAILTKYQQLLEEMDNSRGICLFDTLPIEHPNKYLRGAFQNRFEHAVAGHRLANIDMIASVTDGCSHLTSLCDIATGSFRYVVNEPERDKAGKELISLLKPLFWGKRKEKKNHIFERGILLRPKEVTHAAYKADYEELKNRILDWANKGATP